MTTIAIVVRLPDELAAALKAEKARTGCPVNEFIKRTLTDALKPKEEKVTP